MTPTRTQVFLCTTAKEYKRCRRFCKLNGMDSYLCHPTVYMVREGRIVGVLGSFYHEGLVCMGPLVVHPSIKVKGIIALRLAEVVEALYKEAGLTEYRLAVSKDKAVWASNISAVATLEAEDDDNWWFVRKLHHG